MPLWQLGPLPIEHPAYVRVADRTALDARIQSDGEACPRVFEVAPNGEAALPILEFIHDLQALAAPLWLAVDLREDANAIARRTKPDPLFDLERRTPTLDRAREYRLVKNVDVQYRPLVHAAREVIISLHSCNATALRRAAESLDAEAAELLDGGTMRCNPQTRVWASYLQTLADEVVVTLEQGTTFVHTSLRSSNKSWWKAQPDASQHCSKAIAALFPLAASAPAAKLKAWLTSLRAQFDAMNPPIGGYPATAFEQASAWYMACAIRHFEQAHLGWALLLLHRAVEWLMMAKAAQLGYLDFTRAGGEYKPRQAALVNGDSRPSFASSLKVLSPPQGYFDLFTELNDWRNLLPYTHHMTMAQEKVAQTLICNVLTKLPTYAQSTQWVTAGKAFATPAPLNIEDLLDPDGVLRSAVVPL